MTPINDLPNEILCDIFSLAIQKSHVFPEIFRTGDNFRECVTLIDISRVCRRWREVALTDPSLWSSIYILLDNPSTETLVQATYFASICFVRSKDLPLTIAITLANLSDVRLAHPLMRTVIFHEDRWSQIAINLTPHPRSPESPAISISESEDGAHSLLLGNAGLSHLKEFQLNIGPLLTYSMSQPLLGLESLKITCYNLLDSMYTLTKWLTIAPNLQELEVTFYYDRFFSYAAEQNHCVWLEAAAAETQLCPHFTLPTLRKLNIWAALLPYFTCPALEKYVTEEIPWRSNDLTDYRAFVERSGTPPSFRSIEFKKYDSILDILDIRGYLLPTITNLLITSPDKFIFTMLSERSQEDGVAGFSVLPALEHLEITNYEDECLTYLSSLIASRWDIDVPHRTLKCVKLNRCFASSPAPELLLFPPTDCIDLTEVGENWREIGRCVNEGLSLIACE